MERPTDGRSLQLDHFVRHHVADDRRADTGRLSDGELGIERTGDAVGGRGKHDQRPWERELERKRAGRWSDALSANG